MQSTPSTTQPKKLVVNEDTMSPFEKELNKKLRNKQKKVDTILELEKKIKKKEISPNEEQLSKVASKDYIELEMVEIKNYLDLYKQSQATEATKVKELKK
jgi:hypothetical protein